MFADFAIVSLRFDFILDKLHRLKLRACCEATQWQAAGCFPAVQEQVASWCFSQTLGG